MFQEFQLVDLNFKVGVLLFTKDEEAISDLYEIDHVYLLMTDHLSFLIYNLCSLASPGAI